jgi:hypothetical protein
VAEQLSASQEGLGSMMLVRDRNKFAGCFVSCEIRSLTLMEKQIRRVRRHSAQDKVWSHEERRE